MLALGRKQLQALAKQHGIKANMKNAEIVAELLPLLSHAQPEPAQEPSQGSSKSEPDTLLAAEEAPENKTASGKRSSSGAAAARRSEASRASVEAEVLTSLAAEETPEPKSSSRKRSRSGAAAARRSGASRASVEAEAFTSLAAEETPAPKSASRRSRGRPSRASVDQETSGLGAVTCCEVRRSSSVAAASKKKTATPKNKAIRPTLKKGKPNWDKIHARHFAKMKTIAPKQTKTPALPASTGPGLGKHFSKVSAVVHLL